MQFVLSDVAEWWVAQVVGEASRFNSTRVKAAKVLKRVRWVLIEQLLSNAAADLRDLQAMR